MNVIIVQWAILAGSVIYPQAVSNCQYVGHELAKLLNFLQSYKGLSPSSMHIIGHSLGAQLAGVAGHDINNLARITGLDPAGPFFYEALPKDRLDSSDADFVDVIHTNAGFAGYAYACGHVDFFMNGGNYQKGCGPVSYEGFKCSHRRSYEYYIESLKASESSYGFVCEDYKTFKTGHCLQMQCHNSVGYDVTPVVKGSLYMETQSAPIYLARSISISLALNGNDDAYHCEVYVGIQVLGRALERVEMSSGSNWHHPDSSFSTLVTIPTGTTLNSIQVSIEYSGIYYWCPDTLDVKDIEAYDAFANNRYCVKGNIDLKKGVGQPVTFTLGKC